MKVLSFISFPELCRIKTVSQCWRERIEKSIETRLGGIEFSFTKDMPGIIPLDCNYVPELRTVRWRSNGGTKSNVSSNPSQNINDILLVARELAAADITTQAEQQKFHSCVDTMNR